MSPNHRFDPLLRCPMCHSEQGLHRLEGDGLECLGCGVLYPVAEGIPILLRQDNPLFSPDDYLNARPAPEAPSERPWSALFRSVNLARTKAIRQMAEALASHRDCTVLVVGSGSQRAWLQEQFASAPGVTLAACDIDVGASVDFFADGHELPLRDGCVAGVITTAVLEHVLRPEAVAAEITRVLEPGGILYSEMPFMQQVHEGAYDFTRYTHSGHRLLWRNFREKASGLVAGPGTTTLWALEHLALSLLNARSRRRRSIAKAITRAAFFWLPHLDRLLQDRPAALDGASCTYFLGLKSPEPTTDSAIVEGYAGAQSLRHA